MKIYFYVFFGVLFTFCGKKKATEIKEILTSKIEINKDTLIDRFKDTLLVKPILDSLKHPLNLENLNDSILINTFKNKKYFFNTFSADVDVEYTDNNNRQFNVGLNLRIIKDSTIWASVDILGFEVIRLKITSNDFILLDKFSKKAQILDKNGIEKLIGFPFQFQIIQNLLIGNPIIFDSSCQLLKKTEIDVQIQSSIKKNFKYCKLYYE